MAQVVGKVISIEIDTDIKKQGGGTYKGWELVYKSNQGEVRNIAKPIQSLRFNKGLEAALRNLVAGDDFVLEQEKNAQGFNEVKSITKGGAAVAQAASQTTSGSRGSVEAKPSANGYQNRDFETKEERTTRQRLIVRQSSISSAVSILSVGSKKVDPAEVFALAEEITNFVFEKINVAKEVGTTDDVFEDFEDDIPY